MFRYISNAEIGEIMTSRKRSVTQSFLDASSNSDILVYDDTEWVSYMSDKTKKTRSTLYKTWGMGGTTDWVCSHTISSLQPSRCFELKTRRTVSLTQRPGK
jgi:hypothetical protein